MHICGILALGNYISFIFMPLPVYLSKLLSQHISLRAAPSFPFTDCWNKLARLLTPAWLQQACWWFGMVYAGWLTSLCCGLLLVLPCHISCHLSIHPSSQPATYRLFPFLAPRPAFFKQAGSLCIGQLCKRPLHKTTFSLCRISGTSLVELPPKELRSLNTNRGSILGCKFHQSSCSLK